MYEGTLPLTTRAGEDEAHAFPPGSRTRCATVLLCEEPVSVHRLSEGYNLPVDDRA